VGSDFEQEENSIDMIKKPLRGIDYLEELTILSCIGSCRFDTCPFSRSMPHMIYSASIWVPSSGVEEYGFTILEGQIILDSFVVRSFV
jgi:hypothetical protein